MFFFWLTWLTGNNREGPGRVLWTRGWNAKVYVEVETQNSCFARKSWGCFFSCECQSMLQKKIVLQLEFEVLHLWQDESWKKHPAFCVFDLQVRTKFRELIWYFRSVFSDVREVDMIQIWLRQYIFSNGMPSTLQLPRCVRYAEMDILTGHLVSESLCAKEIIQLPLNRRIMLIKTLHGGHLKRYQIFVCQNWYMCVKLRDGSLPIDMVL